MAVVRIKKYAVAEGRKESDERGLHATFLSEFPSEGGASLDGNPFKALLSDDKEFMEGLAELVERGYILDRGRRKGFYPKVVELELRIDFGNDVLEKPWVIGGRDKNQMRGEA